MYRLSYVVLLFTFCFNLTAQSGEKEVFYVISQLDLISDEVVSKVKSLPSNIDSQSILISFGTGVQNKDQFELLADNIDKLKESYDKIYLIPTSSDWKALNAEGIKDLDDFLEDEFEDDILIPDNACGELETKEVGNKAVIAAMDSKWYLQNWKEDQFINKGCENRDKKMFWLYFSDEIADHKDKVVLLFTYHAPIRYDKAAGNYPTKAHFLPLPILGTLLTALKSYTRGSEFPTHPVYEEYSSRIISAVELEPNVITISGQGNYQMDDLNKEGYYLNINSSKADDYISKGKVDWNSDKPAYLKIIVGKEQSVIKWKNIETHEVIYERTYFSSPEIADTVRTDYHILESLEGDSFAAPILFTNEIPDLDNWVFGELHTDIYFQNVQARVLDLSTEKNGLETMRIGGGRQTRSVRFEDKKGIEYVARSIQKTPDHFVPEPFDITPVEKTISYYFTGAHPYGFMVSSKLEEILGVYRTDPELMFLPSQKALEPYNDELGDRMVLFRSRADDDRSDFDIYANSNEIISTTDFLKEIQENDARPDMRMYLKDRFLDLIINDWDRHEDQFRWAKDPRDTNEVKVYYPIPRDRDQAFSNYNGLGLGIARLYIPLIFQLQPFDGHLSYREIKWAHYISSYIDNVFITELSKEEWDDVREEFLQKMTDENLKTAVESLPEELPEVHKEFLLNNLHERIAEFRETSDNFYKVINKRALVTGSEKEDSIQIFYTKAGTEVTVWSTDDNNQEFVRFHKTFDPAITDEIWIYSQEGDDLLLVNGEKYNRTLVRIVGGYGKDRYRLDKGLKHKVEIYDVREENEIPKYARSLVSNRKEILSLNKRDFMKNYGWFVPEVEYNSDDGFFLGMRYRLFDYEFKSLWVHDFSAAFSTRRSSSIFSYRTLFQSDLHDIDKYIEINYFGPRYEVNYHGTGNDVEVNFDQPEEFYFVRMKRTNMEIGIRKHFIDISHIDLGVQLQRLKIDDVNNRFIQSSQDVNPEVFNSQFFAGLNLAYSLENYDSSIQPHNGVTVEANISANKHLYIGNKDHITFSGSVKMLKSIGVNETIILGSKAGITHLAGDGYFYNLPNIGGGNSLRGFRRERFYGQTAFYHNSNVNIYLMQKRSNNDHDHSLGVSLYFDHGRVWSDQDVADTWHYNYGAGLFFVPLDAIVISAGAFRSVEETKIRIGLGWLL